MLLELSLCSLCALCVSVVKKDEWTWLTTETQRNTEVARRRSLTDKLKFIDFGAVNSQVYL